MANFFAIKMLYDRGAYRSAYRGSSSPPGPYDDLIMPFILFLMIAFASWDLNGRTHTNELLNHLIAVIIGQILVYALIPKSLHMPASIYVVACGITSMGKLYPASNVV